MVPLFAADNCCSWIATHLKTPSYWVFSMAEPHLQQLFNSTFDPGIRSKQGLWWSTMVTTFHEAPGRCNVYIHTCIITHVYIYKHTHIYNRLRFRAILGKPESQNTHIKKTKQFEHEHETVRVGTLGTFFFWFPYPGGCWDPRGQGAPTSSCPGSWSRDPARWGGIVLEG